MKNCDLLEMAGVSKLINEARYLSIDEKNNTKLTYHAQRRDVQKDKFYWLTLGCTPTEKYQDAASFENIDDFVQWLDVILFEEYRKEAGLSVQDVREHKVYSAGWHAFKNLINDTALITVHSVHVVKGVGSAAPYSHSYLRNL